MKNVFKIDETKALTNKIQMVWEHLAKYTRARIGHFQRL
jgi:hypothetical protein